MSQIKISSFESLHAWQQGHILVLLTYKITKQFPGDEKFGLTNQMRRAAVSITSNIAEGFNKKTLKDKINFYYIALGSTSELHNQFIIARDIEYIRHSETIDYVHQCQTVHKLINGLIKSNKALLS